MFLWMSLSRVNCDWGWRIINLSWQKVGQLGGMMNRTIRRNYLGLLSVDIRLHLLHSSLHVSIFHTYHRE